jgi:transposase
VTLATDSDARRVLFVAEGRATGTIEELAKYMEDYGCAASAINSVSIDTSPTFIAGVTEHLPDACIKFGKFHVIYHACSAVRTSAPFSTSEIHNTWCTTPRSRLTSKATGDGRPSRTGADQTHASGGTITSS